MNRRRAPLVAAVVTLVALVVSLASAPAGSAQPEVGPGAVKGVVTDVGGAPVPDIVVSFYRGGSLVGQDETDATGAYEVAPLQPDTFGYYVEFYDPDGEFATEWYDDRSPGDFLYVPVSVTADTTRTGINAVLEAAATITGRLTTATGAPLAGGKVSMWLGAGGGYWSWRTVYTTDATGRYTIDRLKARTYLVEFYDPATGIQEFWDNASNLYASTPIALASGSTVTADAMLGGTIANTRAPTISGTPEVGKALTASPGAWTPAGMALGYRWVVGDDSDPTDDPTGAVYVPRAADVGKTIRVRVTGTALGWLPGSALSAPTGPVAPPAAVVNVVRPRIKGVPRTGRTVWVSRGEWEPEAVARSYQWYVAGRRVRDATLRRFVLRPAHVGKRVKVRVRATAAGHSPVTVWTRTVRVRR
jgi:hypothetical protein